MVDKDTCYFKYTIRDSITKRKEERENMIVWCEVKDLKNAMNDEKEYYNSQIAEYECILQEIG